METRDDDILASEAATVTVLRCSNEECRHELYWDEIEEFHEAEKEDDPWFDCPSCGKTNTVEEVRVTLRERLDEMSESLVELVGSFQMVGDRIPTMRPRIERQLRAVRETVEALEFWPKALTGPTAFYVSGPDGETVWKVGMLDRSAAE